MKEWMMDVRNVYHPEHQEFLEVMKDPYLAHPKVHEWGGGRESGLGPEPYVNTRKMFSIIQTIFCDERFMDRVLALSQGKKIAVYGMTAVGKALASRLKNENMLAYCIDRKMDGMKYLGVPIYGINHFQDLDKDVFVVIALHRGETAIGKMLERVGYEDRVSRIVDIAEAD